MTTLTLPEPTFERNRDGRTVTYRYLFPEGIREDGRVPGVDITSRYSLGAKQFITTINRIEVEKKRGYTTVRHAMFYDTAGRPTSYRLMQQEVNRFSTRRFEEFYLLAHATTLKTDEFAELVKLAQAGEAL